MKEEEFRLDSFIGGWYIPEEICTNLIDFFNNKKNRQLKGLSGNAIIDEDWKKTQELVNK